LFLKWREETEIEDLLKFDIGIMPLPDLEWAKGKCGFKLLQYMALRIPAIASPVGVNTSILADGENGFLCSTFEQWKNGLVRLTRDETLRKKMGEKGRRKVIEYYSVESNASNFLSLFE
jgi:glycosyltransferase involved in cell wall biosynthesis